MNEIETPPLALDGLKQFSWAYRDLIGQKREWTPTQTPRTVVASSSTNPLDDLIRCDCSSAPITMQLETAVGADGRRHTFKKVDSTANAMTLTCFSTQTLDGVTSAAIAVQYGAFSVISNGTNWELTRPLAGVYTNVYDSALSNTQIVYAGAGGLLQGSSGLTFDGSTLAFTSTNALFGASTALAMTGGVAPQVQVHGSTAAMSRVGLARWSADAGAPNLFLGKSRGAAVGTASAVVANDSLGAIVFIGSDNTAFFNAVSIIAKADPGVTTSVVPGRLEIATTNSTGTQNVLALTIDSAQTATFTSTVSASNLTAWSSYTCTRTGWTDVGAASTTARFCQIRNTVFFQVKVVPGTTVATVAGTSYVSLPASINSSALGGDGSMVNDTTFVSVGNCVFDVSNSRCYVPSQTATGNTLSISGWYEV